MKLSKVVRKLGKVPGWLWATAAITLVLIPAALIYAAVALFNQALDSGGELLAASRDQVKQLLPPATEVSAAAADWRERAGALLRGEVDALAKSALAESAASLSGAVAEVEPELAAAVGALGALSNTAQAPPAAPRAEVAAVSGEDPAGIEPLPGSIRIAFAQDESSMRVRYGSNEDMAAAVEHYRKLLQGQGYHWQVLSADQSAEVHRFRSAGREIRLEAKLDERFASVLDWEVRWLGRSAEAGAG